MDETSSPVKSTDYQLSAAHAGPDMWTASGRRAWMAYRDLGLSGATTGDFGFTVQKLTGPGEPTGWHYHELELQVVYVLKGYLDLAMADGRVIHIAEGSCVNIPPYAVHNELHQSPDLEIMELTKPAKITTIPVAEPLPTP